MMIISCFIDRLQYTTRFTLRNSFEVVLIHSSIIFGFSETNLHGDNLFKFSEFATRKELTNAGITFLVQRGFVDVNPTKNGFVYRISSNGRKFASGLNTKYAKEYKEQIRLALSHFSSDSEQTILKKINKVAVASLEKEDAVFHEE